jgi:hypothetical protein
VASLLGFEYISASITAIIGLTRPAKVTPMVAVAPGQNVAIIAVTTAVLLALFAAGTVGYLRWSGQMTSTQVGVTYPRPILLTTLLIGAGALAYIAVVFYSATWTSVLLQHLSISPRPVLDQGAQDTEHVTAAVAWSIHAGICEEIQLFAVPIALMARFQRRLGRCHPLVVLIVLEVLRLGLHLYYGWGALFIVPWIAAAYLLYRIVGLVWPFIIGHAVYDILVMVTNMNGSAAASFNRALTMTAQFGAVALGLILAAWVIGRVRQSQRAEPALG